MTKITLSDYYKHFGSIYGAITALAGILPLLSLIGIDKVSPYIFPPLGDFSEVFKILTLIFIVLITFVVFNLNSKKQLASKNFRANLFLLFLGLIFLSIFSFFITTQIFIEAVPSKTGTIYVSKGYDRLPDKNDERSDLELIVDVGYKDKDLKQIWTHQSIIIARVVIFLSYFFTLTVIVALCCFAVLFDLLITQESNNGNGAPSVSTNADPVPPKPSTRKRKKQQAPIEQQIEESNEISEK